MRWRGRRGRRGWRGSELKLRIKVFRINNDGWIRESWVKVVVGNSKSDMRVMEMNWGRGKRDLVMSKTYCGGG